MDYLQQLIERYPQLISIQKDIQQAYTVIVETYERKGKLLIAGNGGSAADAEHIAGELMKGFLKPRRPPADVAAALEQIDHERGGRIALYLQRGLPAICLSSHGALFTAVLNDQGADMVYAQQVYGYGKPEDVFLGISTSGNADNVINAAITAKALGLKTVALTGGYGGAFAVLADVAVIVPETETYKIQELHLPVYHALCLMIEEHFFK
ncbi:MAG: phosphoheptose isomerase/SIS domain-containing protein [Treponematales bacterium]